MPRLLVHVEGQTEETFVNSVLQEYLVGKGYARVSARIVGNSRTRQRRGGIIPWPGVKKEIVNRLKEDAGSFATTMVDFYALPQDGDGAWPGRKNATAAPAELKASIVERELLADVAGEMGSSFDLRRFVPFLLMHEFEALLFSDCIAFSRSINRPDLEGPFQAIRDQFATPEHIDDSPVSAPSKRICDLIPGYEKPLLGSLAALNIGLDRIRAECPHFHKWLALLEAIVTTRA